jgi:hypothetical protein
MVTKTSDVLRGWSPWKDIPLRLCHYGYPMGFPHEDVACSRAWHRRFHSHILILFKPSCLLLILSIHMYIYNYLCIYIYICTKSAPISVVTPVIMDTMHIMLITSPQLWWITLPNFAGYSKRMVTSNNPWLLCGDILKPCLNHTKTRRHREIILNRWV